MYYLIGADGKEYGPFSDEQVRQWVREGRANAYSRIRNEGETTWQALSQIPELAEASARPTAAEAPPPPLTAEAIAAEYLSRNAQVDIRSALTRGWTLVRDNASLLIGSSALVFLIGVGLAIVPRLGWIASVFVNSALLGGLYYLFIRRSRGEHLEIAEVFAGFRLAYFNLLLAYLVSGLLTAIGVLLFIVPGVYLAIGYMFALPLVIDKKMEFWTAMEVSRRVVHAHWWTVFAFAIVAALVIAAGALALGIGVIVAIPVTLAAMMYVYDDLFGRT